MNLTSKRMLQFMTVCAGACALSALADPITYVSDSFDSNDAGIADIPGSNYRMVVTGGNNEFTNFVWSATEGDASKILAGATDFEVVTRPITNALNDLYLNLETEGQTLSRSVAAEPVWFNTSPVYVDTLIKFTPSEDVPTIDGSVKVAVYVNANSNLVVHHAAVVGEAMPAVDTVFAELGPIDPAVWNRLTIKLGVPTAVGVSACQVYLNGQELVSELGYTEAGDLGGSWLMTVETGGTLSAVQFQGTGAVDELVVADDFNDFAGPDTGILLTLTFDSGISSVLTNGAEVASGSAILNNAVLTINAKDWFRVNAVTGTGSYTPDNGTLPQKVSTGTVTGANESTIAVESVAVSAFPTGYGSSVAAWAVAKGKTEDEVLANAEGWLDDYLFGVDPDTNAKLVISEINVVDGDASVVITTDKPNLLLSGINGTLKYLYKDALSDPSWAAENVSVSGAGAAVTVPIESGNGKFFKAVLE